MTTLKKILVAGIVFISVWLIVGFAVLPMALKPVAVKKISQVTQRNVAMAHLKFNPLALSITIEGFRIEDTEGGTPFLTFEKLHINFNMIRSVFRRAMVLEEIRLEKPYLHLTRQQDGTYNFTDLIPKEQGKREEPSTPFHFSLNNIRIADGRIDFHDLPNKTKHNVRDLQLTIPLLSNMEQDVKTYVEPTFSAVVNGDPVRAAGKTMLFESSHATIFDIDLSDVNIPHYLQYVPVQFNFKLVSAALDTHLRVTFMTHPDRRPDLSLTGQAKLKNVLLHDLQGNKLFGTPSLKVDIASLEPLRPSAHLVDIVMESPELAIHRHPKGEINLSKLFNADRKTDAVKTKNQERPETTTAQPAGAETGLSLRIDNVLIDKGLITFTDTSQTKPVKILVTPFKLQASNVSLAPGEKAQVDLALTLDRKADITAQGLLAFHPLDADLLVAIRNLNIRLFEPYLTESIQLDITRGSLTTEGKLTVKMDSAKPPRIVFTGNLAIQNFASIDRIHAHDFFKFRQLAFHSLSVGYNPQFVNIQTVSLADFFAKIAIYEGGTTNLQDMIGSSSKDIEPKKTLTDPLPQKEKTPAPSSEIKIGKVSFSGGRIDFSDQNIKPNYRANMLNLQGSVTGLSSQEFSRAHVDLKGNLGYGSPIEVSGTINPLVKDLFADIKVSFKNIDMSAMSPYTIKFLGYPVTKGKLHFDVSYRIDKKKLNAENKIFFDQLTFGEKVDSPDAIKAPVTLAVSLLTDRQGQINLDIPVSGSLDDPQFKLWPIIWQILVNLITKAVTSPFALLSSLTGGGEEMSYIEFDYGASQLSETAIQKVDALSKVLFDRPNLKLDIEGYADASQDKEALRRLRLNRLVKNQKLKEMLDKGKSDMTVDDVVVLPTEYVKYLTLAYKAADFPKPRTTLGLLKELPPNEMEKLLYDHIVVSDNDLMQLAARRAQTVREHLLKKEQIDPARIFLVHSSSLAPEKKDNVKSSRVNFKVK